MHRRDLRRCLSVGVASVIRRLILVLMLLPLFAQASTLTLWGHSNIPSLTYSTGEEACGRGRTPGNYWPIPANNYLTLRLSSSNKYDCEWFSAQGGTQYFGQAIKTQTVCQFGDNGSTCNTSCDAPKVMENGQCITPVNPCLAKKDQQIPYIQKFPSFDAYVSSCTGSVDGCALDTCAGTSSCGTNGETGEFACWGTGKYTGEQQPVADGTAPNPPPIPEPTTTDSSQSCTAPAVNAGTTTYTCLTKSNATEFASANCAVGTVNGVQGLHCTKPDYVPEHDSKKREDQVTEVTNPDGSKTSTTTSTTTTTHCAAGACNTTTNVTTTTSGKDANGNPTGTTTTCKGDKCDNPTTPGKDESEEDDEEEGTAAPFVPGDKGDYLPEIGGGDEAPTYAESLDDFTDRVSNAPIVRGLTSITVPSGGICSMGSAQLFGGSVSFDDFCTMAPQVLAGLRYLFLAIWAWASIRLFFTA